MFSSDANRVKAIYNSAICCALPTVLFDHSLQRVVSAHVKKAVTWICDSGMPAGSSIIGSVLLGNLEVIFVVTGNAETQGRIVDFCYAHELGHVVLEHFEEETFLFGPPTAELEREADGFAVAYLAITKPDEAHDELWQVFKNHRDDEDKLDVSKSDFDKELRRIEEQWHLFLGRVGS